VSLLAFHVFSPPREFTDILCTPKRTNTHMQNQVLNCSFQLNINFDHIYIVCLYCFDVLQPLTYCVNITSDLIPQVSVKG
jgi:hypothetical protein